MLRILVLGVATGATLCGCGAGAPNCDTQLVAAVGPANATVDHLAKVPGNQQQFIEGAHYVSSSPGCAVPALAFSLQPDWTVSDPVNVSISSAKDSTNGLATCLGATNGAVTVTAGAVTVTAGAVGSAASATASLTCQ